VPVVDVGSEAAQSPQDGKCSCIPPNTPIPQDHHASFWSYPLPWDSTWSHTEVRKEQSRRLCWSALNLVASYTSRCALLNKKPPNFFLGNPANVSCFCKHLLLSVLITIQFAIFFPGEIADHTSPSPKESVWALYCRSMLLWNFCVQLRNNAGDEEDKAEYALEAWAETQAIQDSLDMHVCNLNTALIYISREYICKCVPI
jgi:hypothetical protein